ncbi:hypothetical protein [Cohnella hongkongensis]|uniref:Methyl-accepting chemotaxis protein n=1 Tax=Cohnella hongkongensis TaxID=178337 RepID=A0ABV9F442_9BACL
MRNSVSFYNKLLIFFILVGVIPLLIIGSMTYGFSKRFFLDQYRQQLHDKVAGAAERFDALSEEYSGMMSTIGELPEVRQALLRGNAELKKNVEQRASAAGRQEKQSGLIFDPCRRQRPLFHSGAAVDLQPCQVSRMGHLPHRSRE